MNGKSFKKVMDEFINWCGENTIFVTFGEFDRKILELELERNEIDNRFLYPIVDFQQKYMIEHNLKAQPSLLNLLSQFQIPNQIHHRALADAYSLMNLFKEVDGETMITKQQTNHFIFILTQWKQWEEQCECSITYVTGTISPKLKINAIKSIQKRLSIKVIESNDDPNDRKEIIEPNIEITKFLQEMIRKLNNKVLITKSNSKTISRICRIHQCTLPKTEMISLQSLIKDVGKVNQFLMNDMNVKEYEQKICYLIYQYSNKIKEEFSKRHLFKKVEITL